MRGLLISAEKIIDCLNDGVYVCDRDRRIVFWSKAAERITGWRSEDVLGRACLEDILNHVDKDGHRLCGEEYCPLHRAMITGVTTQVPIIVFARRKDGSRVPTQVTTAPIQNEAGEIIGGVASGLTRILKNTILKNQVTLGKAEFGLLYDHGDKLSSKCEYPY